LSRSVACLFWQCECQARSERRRVQPTDLVSRRGERRQRWRPRRHRAGGWGREPAYGRFRSWHTSPCVLLCQWPSPVRGCPAGTEDDSKSLCPRCGAWLSGV